MQATWKLPNGQAITLDVAEGTNLMQAAVARGIPGVVGECGGSLSCATCHVVVAPDWADRAGPPGAFEEDMLDITEAERQPSSRLSCQIRMSADLDGIVVSVPAP
ncbi:2Fe-2S iron-sulfur cluster-binding protein [Fuscovulum ytuae]|uniref:2Fe-2S iron-sulfur cluster-binding protein n=1 Tax=Fuscovulum ytuae TaxID=3042299 RepID=A0ABY8QAP9_9RHOB|nr:2Fe-2S iron-sulfur cluster-binding protein [Fuscovulum sp. YMD61]WGV17310.1 2Fe-2S iron-sulfur cluster-binding protein [Fuscovulum sp. YMD61]